MDLGPTVCIDFETYYDDTVSVVTLGAMAYARHPEFYSYLVSIEAEDGSYVGCPLDAPWDDLGDRIWLSHNAQFDQCVFYEWVLKQLGQEAPDIPHWYDTAGLTAYLQAGRSLFDAVKSLYGVKLNKAVRNDAKGKHWPQDFDALEQKEMTEYAGDDAIWPLRIWNDHSHKWPERERKLSEYTVRAATRGVAVNQERVQEDIMSLKNILFEAEAELPWMNGDDPKAKPLSPKSLAVECRKVGITPPKSLAQDSSECEAWEQEYGETYTWVDAMRRYRKANTLLKKYETLNRCLVEDENGTVFYSYQLKYCGAPATRRFSGDAGFNMQNLPKEAMFGCDLRAVFISRPGKKFIIVDLAQIEARVILWLVNDQESLDLIRQGISVYEVHARATMGWTGGVLKKEDPKLYAAAKARVLGLGFGCGAERFVEAAWVLARYKITPEESKVIVKDYRKNNPKITGLWKYLDEDMKVSKGEDYFIELPSGNIIRYADIRSTPKGFVGNVETTARGIKKLYGGLLTENLVQATARDIFGDAVIRMEEAGHDVLWTVHDEAIVEVDMDVTEEQIIDLMTVSPDWADGLPLEAEAQSTNQYTK